MLRVSKALDTINIFSENSKGCNNELSAGNKKKIYKNFFGSSETTSEFREIFAKKYSPSI